MNTLYNQILQARQELERLHDVAEEATQNLSNELDVMICYHNHYERPAFSIFQSTGDLVTETQVVSEMAFFVDSTMDVEEAEKIIQLIVEEMHRDKD